MKNEILDEVWKSRDRFARRCKHNLSLMVKELRKVERTIGNPIINRSKKNKRAV
jgi:hypothetical protein